MTDYDNSNRIAIWGNEKKDSERHPDFKGNGNFVCPCCQAKTEVWASGWKRKPDGNPKAPALSLSIQPKEQQQAPSGTGGGQFAPSQTPPTQPQATPEFEDAIPFANPYKRKEYLL